MIHTVLQLLIITKLNLTLPIVQIHSKYNIILET